MSSRRPEEWETVAEGMLSGAALKSVLRTVWSLSDQYKGVERDDLGQELALWAWENEAEFRDKYADEWPGCFDKALQRFGNDWCHGRRLQLGVVGMDAVKHLTKRQWKILRWTDKGTPQWLQAKILDISQQRVAQELGVAMEKRGVATAAGVELVGWQD